MSRSPDKEFNLKLPVDKDKFGANQRLRFLVPTPATTLVLGQRWADDPPFGFSGASLRTVANLFIDIKEQTLFQGHRAVTFQTSESWTQYSTGQTTVYAKANVDVTSAAAVLIAAVPAKDEEVGADMQDETGDTTVPAVSSYSAIRDAMLDITHDGIKTWDGLADDVKAAKDDLGHEFAATEIKDLVANAATITKSMKSGSDDHSGATHAGIGLASTDPIAMYTAANIVGFGTQGVVFVAGTSDAAKDFSVIASQDVDLRAGVHAELFGKTSAALEGGSQADVTSKGPVSLSSRTKEAIVLGKDIHIGSTAADEVLGGFTRRDPSKQKPTKNVTVRSATQTKIDSDDNVEVVAKKKVTITVGSYKVVIEEANMKIGKIDGQITVEIKDDEIAISAGPTQSVKINKSNGVKITSGGTSIVANSSGATISGSAVKLG